MSIVSSAFLVLYSLVLVVWAVRRVVVGLAERKLPLLRRTDPQYQPATPPLVSVLIPAKDEEHTIGACLESILRQSYRNIEVFVIDDHSRDGTVAVVQEWVRRDRRVRLLRTGELPPGWTGKTYALHQGVLQSRGEWLWFLDADTRHAPENLAVALQYADRHQVDLVTLLPALENRTFWERVIQPPAAIVLLKMYNLVQMFASEREVPSRMAGAESREWRIDAPRDMFSVFANGQYILIRREVYETVGGHEQVRDQFLEDVQLGRCTAAQGYQVRVVLGRDISRARMYWGGREVIRGWSRIFYGATPNRPSKLLAALASVCVFSLSAILVLAGWFGGGLSLGWREAVSPIAAVGQLPEIIASTSWLRTMALMNLLHWALIVSTMSQLYSLTGSSRRWVAFYPLASLAVSWILMRAVWLCYTHRVSWRGRDYHRSLPTHRHAQGAGSLLTHRPPPTSGRE